MKSVFKECDPKWNKCKRCPYINNGDDVDFRGRKLIRQDTYNYKIL